MGDEVGQFTQTRIAIPIRYIRRHDSKVVAGFLRACNPAKAKFLERKAGPRLRRP